MLSALVGAAQFYAMVSFACPDMLGTLAAFRRVFADPISRARDRDASAEERALGAQRSAELARPTSPTCLSLRTSCPGLSKCSVQHLLSATMVASKLDSFCSELGAVRSHSSF